MAPLGVIEFWRRFRIEPGPNGLGVFDDLTGRSKFRVQKMWSGVQKLDYTDYFGKDVWEVPMISATGCIGLSQFAFSSVCQKHVNSAEGFSTIQSSSRFFTKIE